MINKKMKYIVLGLNNFRQVYNSIFLDENKDIKVIVNSPAIRKKLLNYIPNGNLLEVKDVDFSQLTECDVIVYNVTKEEFWLHNKEKVYIDPNISVVAVDPVNYFTGEKIMKHFDNVVITKTKSGEKQVQYFTLFLSQENSHITLSQFKNEMKMLRDEEYFQVKDDGSLEKHKFIVKMETDEKQAENMDIDMDLDKLYQLHIDLFSDDLGFATKILQEYLRNEIFIPTHNTSLLQKIDHEGKVSFIITPHADRRDLFYILIFNALFEMKHKKYIHRFSVYS